VRVTCWGCCCKAMYYEQNEIVSTYMMFISSILNYLIFIYKRKEGVYWRRWCSIKAPMCWYIVATWHTQSPNHSQWRLGSTSKSTRYNTSSPDHAYNNYSFMCIVSRCGMHQDSSQYRYSPGLLCHALVRRCSCICGLGIHLLAHCWWTEGSSSYPNFLVFHIEVGMGRMTCVDLVHDTIGSVRNRDAFSDSPGKWSMYNTCKWSLRCWKLCCVSRTCRTIS
jgi:hypothetical protein